MTDKIHQAVELHRAGQLDQAEAIYRSILTAEPHHAEALHYLGLARAARGDTDTAGALIARSLDEAPDNAETHFHFAILLEQLGRRGEALSAAERAIALADEFIEAQEVRARLLLALGRSEEAVAAYERLVELKPDLPDAAYGCGYALLLVRRFDEALAAFDGVIAGNAGHIEALCARGLTLAALGRSDEALRAFGSALSAKSDYLPALDARSALLWDMGRFQEALADADHALVIEPRFAPAHRDRGKALAAMGQAETALEAFDRALAYVPNFIDALNLRAELLQEAGRHSEALRDADRSLAIDSEKPASLARRGDILVSMGCVQEAMKPLNRALELSPDFVIALCARGTALRQMQRLEEARRDFDYALTLAPGLGEVANLRFDVRAWLCDWNSRAADMKDLKARVEAGQVMQPWTLLAAFDDPALQLKAARQFAPPGRGATFRPRAHDRLRIAYMSADFRDHPVAYQMAEIFEHHDRIRFETWGICLLTSPDTPIRRRLKAGLDHFEEAQRLSDAEVASLLRLREIDIVVDLTGYTVSRKRVLSSRPVPVSVSYLGYSGTLGTDFIDYLLADSHLVPEGDEHFYAEAVARLPGSFFPTAAASVLPPAPSRAEEGLPEGFVFCAFNSPYKLTPELFDIWMRLLKTVDHSVLWLSLKDGTPRENLKREACAQGVDAERLVFAPRLPERRDHFARLQCADLFLDTHPYNAHTTASDALYAGLPVLTASGHTFAGRVAGSLLAALGVPELIAPDLGTYEKLALKLARSPDRLTQLRAKIAENRRRLFDPERLTRNVERAFETMWANKGDKPRSFFVATA